MAKKPQDFEKFRAKIIARAWKDPQYKQKLLKNPKAAFKEMGYDLQGQFEVRVVEDTQKIHTFILPVCVARSEEMSDQELEKFAAGAGNATDMAHTAPCWTWTQAHLCQ